MILFTASGVAPHTQVSQTPVSPQVLHQLPWCKVAAWNGSLMTASLSADLKPWTNGSAYSMQNSANLAHHGAKARM
jgi:hypothetical protein